MSGHNYEFFWGHPSPFSNWHPCTFEMDGLVFNCSEQAMMYYKAMLFKDEETAKKIMESKDPWEQKRLGRKVVGFTDELWNANRMEIMVNILLAKFSQNKDLHAALMGTGVRMFVEASPYDRIWGIGLSADDPRALDEKEWQGLNLLGKALDTVKGILLT